MHQRLEALGNEAVPCWGGTGSVPNPKGFRGDCDAHPPKMNCTEGSDPPVFQPGWCTPAPAPAPAPSGALLSCHKPAGSYCEHKKHACGANPSDPRHSLHVGDESLEACEAMCTANAACNCIR
jgi:hypothetical protein